MVMRVKERGLPPSTYVFDGTLTQMTNTTPLFYTADGGIHPTVYLTTPFATSRPSLDTVTTAGFIRYERSTGTMEYPDGIVAHYNSSLAADGSPVGDGRLLDFADPFGNTVTLVQSGTSVQVTQSLGPDAPRIVTLELNAEGLPVSMTYAPAGVNRVWQYSYLSAGSPAGPQTDLESVTPPVGPGWLFGYDVDYLRWLRTPQGGRIDYGYEYRTVSVGPSPTDLESLSILVSRTTSGGASPWTITTDFDPTAGFSRATLIQTPSGAQVEYRHLPQGTLVARLLSGVQLTDHYVRDASGAELQHERRIYQLIPNVYHSATSWWGTAEIAVRTITRDGRDFVTSYTYDPATVTGDFHHPQTVVESSNGSTRTTTFDYRHYGYELYWSPGLFLLGRLQFQQVQVGTDTWVRRWAFDSTGFPTETRDWAGPSENLPIVRTFTRDAQGNVATEAVGSGPVTSYAYQYGQVREIRTPEHTSERVINPDGTVERETQAGRTTTYTYDALGRVLSSQPPGGAAPTLTSYDLLNGSWMRVARGNDFTETAFDGFGRAVATQDAVGVQTRTV
jgi:YD repeat-containing protein